MLKRLFEPLGYTVTAEPRLLDERFPEWGQSRYFRLTLGATLPLRQLLTHLYVILPVLDNDKHYWVGDDEVEKLLRRGEGWLPQHPERDLITRRYLKHRRDLVNDALARLVDDDPDPDETEHIHAAEEAEVEARISLNEQRLGTVLATLKQSGAKRVLDLGCGEGRLLQSLLKERQFEEIVGMDVFKALANQLAIDLHPCEIRAGADVSQQIRNLRKRFPLAILGQVFVPLCLFWGSTSDGFSCFNHNWCEVKGYKFGIQSIFDSIYFGFKMLSFFWLPR